MKLNRRFIIFCLILAAVSTVIKIICAPQLSLSGFSGVFAVALFSGLTIKDKGVSFLLPLVVLFISDVILQVLHAVNLFPFAGFYDGQTLNYALFFLVTLSGMLLRTFRKAGIIASVFIGPLVFFLISNYTVWYSNSGLGYSRDFSGLMECYRVALPFYRNSVISTAVFLHSFIALYQFMFKETFVESGENKLKTARF